MRTLRTQAWTAMGHHNPLARATVTDPMIIDIDATHITSHSQDKQGAARTWKKGFGFHPLCASVDFGPGLGTEDLAIDLRPGNAGADTADDHIHLARRALAGLPGAHRGGRWSRRILFRTDTGGKAKSFINYLDRRNVAYSVGVAVNQDIGTLVSTLPEDLKHPVIASDNATKAASQHDGDDYEMYADLDKSYVADITALIDRNTHHITLADYPADMRILVRVEYPAAGCQLRVTDIDGRRVTAFATNQLGSPTTLDLRHRGRGRCEQRIRDTKNLGLSKLPHTDFDANRIWCHTVVLAGCLAHWSGILGAPAAERETARRQARTWRAGHRNLGDDPDGNPKKKRRPTSRTRWWLWEPKTWRARLGSIAAVVSRHARALTMRFDAAMEFTDTLIAAVTRIRSLTIP